MFRSLAILVILVCARIAGAATTVPAFVDRYDYNTLCGGIDSFPTLTDTNGDSIPDLVCGGLSLSVYFGNGNGTFRAGPSSPMGFAVGNMLGYDLNGDGKIDLVGIGDMAQGVAGLSVSFGNGDGTFQPATFYAIGNVAASYLVLGDFNVDGKPDVAISGNTGVWLFTGQGNGLFSAGTLIPVTGAYDTAPIASADFNGDGKLDIAVAADFGVSILLGNGDGTFQLQINVPSQAIGDGVLGFSVGDLNGDGVPDLAYTSALCPAIRSLAERVRDHHRRCEW